MKELKLAREYLTEPSGTNFSNMAATVKTFWLCKQNGFCTVVNVVIIKIHYFSIIIIVENGTKIVEIRKV